MAKKKTWLDKGIDSLSKRGLLEGKTILKNSLPKKMSEVLLDFAKPLLDGIDTSDKRTLDAALKVAVTVWNYAVMSGKSAVDSTDAELKNLFNTIIAHGFSDPIGKEVLRVLLGRKKQMYPELTLKIADFDLKWDSDGEEFHVTVISTE